MTRSIRVAAVQLRAHDRTDFVQELDAILTAVDEAAAVADLVVLPEATFPSYVLGSDPIDDAVLDGAIERLQAAARRDEAVIVVGAAALSPQAPLRFNAALVIDRDGSFAGRADKLFLWHFDRRWFAPGERVEPIDTSLGRLGVLICADGRIPTISRALVDRGAELLVMPTAWVTSGRNPRALENVQADLLVRVRAYENGVPFVASNKCGAELGMVAYCGKSQIVAADGATLAIAGEFEPETLVASLEIGAAAPHRTAVPPLARRANGPAAGVRIAISARPVDAGDPRLVWLDAAYAIAPPIEGQRLAELDRAFPTVLLSGDAMLDPGLAAAHRLAGCALIVWETRGDSAWTDSIARARALELRAYVVVIDAKAGRAFAVDPDGIVVAGTFGDYQLAALSLEPRKVTETQVAPGSDVLAGLERVAALLERGARVSA